jgi:hypothetical protein
MWTAFLAVCLAGTLHADCNRDTAVRWFSAPEDQMVFVDCLRTGMMFGAESNQVAPGTYLKVFCRSSKPARQRFTALAAED